MATFNTKTIQSVSLVTVNDGAPIEQKPFIIKFEDGSEKLIGLGLAPLERQAQQAAEQIKQLQNIIAEFEALKPMVLALK